MEVSTFTVGTWLAALVTGLLLLALLAKFGNSLPKWYHVDDLIRLFVAVFCVAGPLSLTPRFHSVSHWIQEFFSSGMRGFRGGSDVAVVVAAILLIVVAVIYLAKPSLFMLIVIVVASLPLFANPAMQLVAQWYVNGPGSWLFRQIINVLNWAAGY